MNNPIKAIKLPPYGREVTEKIFAKRSEETGQALKTPAGGSGQKFLGRNYGGHPYG